MIIMDDFFEGSQMHVESAVVEKFQLVNKIVLPGDYIYYLENLNGLSPKRKVVRLPFKCDKTVIHNFYYLSPTLKNTETRTVNREYKQFSSQYKTKKYLPICEDGFGDQFCLELDTNKIYFLEVAQGAFSYLSSSFTDFIKSLVVEPVVVDIKYHIKNENLKEIEEYLEHMDCVSLPVVASWNLAEWATISKSPKILRYLILEKGVELGRSREIALKNNNLMGGYDEILEELQKIESELT